MRFFYTLLLTIAFSFCCAILFAQSTTLISSTGDGGFETGTTLAANNWVSVNGTQANYWMTGTGATGYTGARCAFATSNGVINNYNHISGSVVHFYKDITFPASQPYVTLTFSWLGYGESAKDYLSVFLVPTTTTPVAGNDLISGQIGSTYNLQTSWQTETILICGVAGTTKRLVFSWRNDNTGGTNPAASLDNISLVSSTTGSTCLSALGTGVVNISSLPYASGSGTTVGSVNDLTSANTVSCGSDLYLTGQDQVFIFTPVTSGQISIALTSTGSSTGLMLYDGCPVSSVCSGSAGSCITFSQSSSGSKSMCASVVAGQTYYLVLDSYASPPTNPYSNLTISAPDPTGSPNDLPCNATSLTLGVNLAGDNSCATGTGEPAIPNCWSTGSVNTLWYAVVCPASGQLRIRTTSGTLTDTQIGLYTGSCSSLTTIAAWCNNDAPACGTSSYSNSELTITSGLTPLATYYIAVDGRQSNTGSFNIMATDASQAVASLAGQECFSPNPVCNQTLSVGNPGFQAYGNVCDFPGGGGNCLLQGERGSAWYEFQISSAGSLEFDIVPNDWPGTGTSSTDYDFAIWKTAGSGAVTCSQIASGVAPLTCNYSNLGVTGCYAATGNSPPGYPGFSAAYEPKITVASGETYMLVVSNFSNSTSGFTLNIAAAAPVSYTAPTQVIWSGGTDSSWTQTGNWGGCTYPSCVIDAVIAPAASNQPILISGTMNAKSLTINPGSTLTLKAGATLNICGDFTNYGSIDADPASTIAFTGTGTQNIYGALVGSDQLGNMTINKTSGSVILHAAIDVSGNLSMSNGTSILNANGQYISVAGNISNPSGATTFTGTSNSMLEFNGTANQNFTMGGSLTFSSVVVNQLVAASVTLLDYNLNISGTLTLDNGRITTGTHEVNVTSNAAGAVNSGNTDSYVDGYLRRSTASTGSYDFPVGNYAAGKGYQRANINFTAGNTATSLLASFNSYASLPGALGSYECGVTYNLPALDNGYWTIASTPASSAGTYTATLYNTAGTYTNSAGASTWTIIKKPSTGAWALNGTCSTSTINQVVRVGMSGFSDFGTGQSSEILPIELTAFTGQVTDNGNLLQWVTAAEYNNDYFLVERSADGSSFAEITKVTGAGNTAVQHHYAYTDGFPFEGYNYYRLKQVNYDGTFSYSQVIMVENENNFPLLESINPNPAYSLLNVALNTQSGGSAIVELIDLCGEVMLREKQDISNGKSVLSLDVHQVPRGVYFLRCTLAAYGFVGMEKVVLD